jgi:hypothetical protein
MRFLLAAALLFAFSSVSVPTVARAEAPASEAKAIFNGESLEGWKGRNDLWSVAEGAIVGTSTAEAPLKSNTFLIYEGDVPPNFELTAQFLIKGGNSGIQYRSKVIDEKEFIVGGYQADIDFSLTFAGINYEERGRGILAQRGQRVTFAEDGSKKEEQFGDGKKLGEVIKGGEWNTFRVVANGNVLQHYINDTLTSEVIDGHSEKAAKDGVIALQLHAGPPMVIMYKDLKIKALAD